MNLKNPDALAHPNPTGLDVTIETARLKLASLTWLEKSFGRAKEIKRKEGDRQISEPMVYQGSKDYYPAMPSDTLKAYSFFRVAGSRDADNVPQNITAPLYLTSAAHIIFWCDLKKIDSSKDYIFTEELITDATKKLRLLPQVKILRVWDEKVEDVFSGYTIQPNHRELLMFPYQAFRFEVELSYQITC